MSAKAKLDRRGFLTRGARRRRRGAARRLRQRASAAAWVQRILDKAEDADARQRRGRSVAANALAREYSEADISKDFKANGSTGVDDDAYRAMAANGLPTGSSRSAVSSSSRSSYPRRAARHAVAHADHAARLRRRLELHRQMDRRAAQSRCSTRPGSGRGALHRASTAPTISGDGDDDGKYYEIDRARWTHSIRRPSSPTR